MRSYEDLLARLHALQSQQLRMQELGTFDAAGKTYPFVVMHLGTPAPGRVGVMLASGIHGDEPAGVEAVVQFLEVARADEELLSRFHFLVFPCNNPCGWEHDTRENCSGIDLNREFNVKRPAPEVVLVMKALQERCFELVFEMHEDIDAPGFYLYEIVEDAQHHVAELIVDAVREAGYPVNNNHVIEGMRAKGGIIRRTAPKFRKTRVPQAIYAYRACGGHVLTLEPPASMLPLQDRVNIELIGLRIALTAHRPT